MAAMSKRNWPAPPQKITEKRATIPRFGAPLLLAAAWLAACVSEQERALVGVSAQSPDAETPTTLEGRDAARDAGAEVRDAGDAAAPRDASPAPVGDAGPGAAGCTAPRVWTNHACGQWREQRGGSLTRNGVWAHRADDVWTVGNGGSITRWNGSAWETLSSGVTTDLFGVWGTDSNDVWVVGDAGVVLHWDGVRWSLRAPGVDGEIAAVHGTGPNDVWVAGDGAYAHWTGASWVVTSERTRWNALWMATPRAGMAVGSEAAFAVLPDGRDRGGVGGSSPVLATWGSAANDFWASNNRGDIFHWNGVKWSLSREDSFLNLRSLRGMWGAHADDVWVVATGGVMFHWDGRRWNESDVSPGFFGSKDLNAVSGAAAGEVWAVGENGAVYRFSP